MVIKEKPINVSNTTLSTYHKNRHRKFDAKQSKRHDFGKAYCVICDEVFTKYSHNTKCCSRECRAILTKQNVKRYHEENREKLDAHRRKWCEENPEKVNAYNRKYREENSEKVNARRRKWREENREKVNGRVRKYREENREKVNARQRKYYHANKEK